MIRISKIFNKNLLFIFLITILIFGKFSYFLFYSEVIFSSKPLILTLLLKDLFVLIFFFISLKYCNKEDLKLFHILIYLLLIFIFKSLIYDGNTEYSFKILRNYILPCFSIYFFYKFRQKANMNYFIFLIILTIPFALAQLVYINYEIIYPIITQTEYRVNAIFDNPVLYSAILFLGVIHLSKSFFIDNSFFERVFFSIFVFLIITTLSLSIIILLSLYIGSILIYLIINNEYKNFILLIFYTVIGYLIIFYFPISYEYFNLKLSNLLKYFSIISTSEIPISSTLNSLNIIQEGQFHTFRDKNTQVYEYLSFSCGSELINSFSILNNFLLGCSISGFYESEVSLINFLSFFGAVGLLSLYLLYSHLDVPFQNSFNRIRIVFILSLIITSVFFSFPLNYLIIFFLINFKKYKFNV